MRKAIIILLLLAGPLFAEEVFLGAAGYIVDIPPECQDIVETPAGDKIVLSGDCVIVDTPVGVSYAVTEESLKVPDGYVSTPLGLIEKPVTSNAGTTDGADDDVDTDTDIPSGGGDNGCFISTTKVARGEPKL